MPKLVYKVANLLDAYEANEVNVIAHQANCFHAMGAGIAPLIANRWPKVREVDQATIKGDESKLGHFSMAATLDPDHNIKFVFNLYGQFRPGPDTRYDKLEQAMIGMATLLSADKDIMRIGFPKLGCGIGGGDWKVVEAMIIKHFVNQGFTVSVYVLDIIEVPLWALDNL